MRRTWVHPEYSISRSLKLRSTADCIDAGPECRQVDSITYFVMLSLVALFFGFAVLVIYSGRSGLPHFHHQASSSFDQPTLFSSWKKALFGAEQTSLDRQASKIRNIILKSGHIKNTDDATDLARSIVTQCASLGYDPLFVTSVIKHESGFNRHAVSRVGAQGLMQIMPKTGEYLASQNSERWLGWWRLRDTHYNLRLGISYLKQLEEQFNGNRELALIAYNWGPNNLVAAKLGKARVPSSTLRYAKSILNMHQALQKAA